MFNPTLNAQIDTLVGLLPQLSDYDAKFAISLIASYKKYHSLTPKQEPWIAKLIAGVVAKEPVIQAPPQWEAKVPDEVTANLASTASVTPPGVHVGSMAAIQALFAKAKAHLKFPKITLKVGHKTVILAVAGPSSKFPGHLVVAGPGKFPGREYYGRITPDGQWLCAVKTTNEVMLAWLAQLEVALTGFASNPSEYAANHGKTTGNCCFCNKGLGHGEEKRSVIVGYGPVCATHFGLKAQWDAAADKITTATLKSVFEKLSFEKLSTASGLAAKSLKDVAAVIPTLMVSPSALQSIAKIAADKEEAAVKMKELFTEDFIGPDFIGVDLAGVDTNPEYTAAELAQQEMAQDGVDPSTLSEKGSTLELLFGEEFQANEVAKTVQASVDEGVFSPSWGLTCFFCAEPAVGMHYDQDSEKLISLCQSCAVGIGVVPGDPHLFVAT